MSYRQAKRASILYPQIILTSLDDFFSIISLYHGSFRVTMTVYIAVLNRHESLSYGHISCKYIGLSDLTWSTMCIMRSGIISKMMVGSTAQFGP
jgi:hypothetical protein